MHNFLMKKYPDHIKTCSIMEPKPFCFTFIRSEKYLKYLKFLIDKDVIVIAPRNLKIIDDLKIETIDYSEYVFTLIHNTLCSRFELFRPNIIGKDCFIHPTAVLDVEGIHYVKAPDDSRVQMKHIGNVVLKDNVSIFALSTIQRGIFGSTILNRGVKIDSHVNIGHNSCIGENTVIALGAILGGSTTIGKNCMIGLGAIIKNGTSICDNVIIGQGSNVVSDIIESGIYMGNPAKLFKPYDKEWNF